MTASTGDPRPEPEPERGSGFYIIYSKNLPLCSLFRAIIIWTSADPTETKSFCSLKEVTANAAAIFVVFNQSLLTSELIDQNATVGCSLWVTDIKLYLNYQQKQRK